MVSHSTRRLTAAKIKATETITIAIFRTPRSLLPSEGNIADTLRRGTRSGDIPEHWRRRETLRPVTPHHFDEDGIGE